MINRILALVIMLSETGLFVWFLGDIPRREIFRRPVRFLYAIAALFTGWYILRSVLYDNSFVLVFLLLFAAMLAIYQLTPATAFYLSGVFTAFLYAGGIILLYPLLLTGRLDSGLGMQYDRQPILIAVELGLLVIKAVSVGLFKRLLPELRAVKLSRLQLFNSFLPVIVAFVMNNNSVLLKLPASPSERQQLASMMILLGVFIYASVGSAALVIRYQYRDTENLRIRQNLKEQYSLYEKNAAHEDAIRKLNHDMRNHLLVIDGLSREDPVHSYVQEILGEMASLEHASVTNNIIVDSLINAKKALMQEKGITLKAVADLSELKGIADPDLCAIFGNALDNAMEAAAETDGEEKKMITLKAYFQSGMWVMQMANYFKSPLRSDEGTLQSAHGPSRGLGMKSIRYAAEKYGGSVSYDVNGDYFTLRVTWLEESEDEERNPEKLTFGHYR